MLFIFVVFFFFFFVFFFQAEDGIRDVAVTGVQTCALPIWSEFDKDPRLIDKGLWDGVVDTVGGKILANAIVQTKPNGIIAVCGNANNNELNTSVIPFMLRGIKLWGMDSANCSIKRREFIWAEASKLIDFDLLEKSILTVSLEELIETYPKILKGEISGRVIVDLNK